MSDPIFTLFSTNSLGLTDIGNNAAPTLADIDNDGDLDAFVGNFDGDTVFFRNTPINGVASFTAESSNFGLTDVGYSAKPLLIDIDGDSDLDAFVGNNVGNTVFFRNTPINGVASFTAESSNFGLTYVGTYASPTFADIDNDGDFDTFVGNSNGDTVFFINTPVWGMQDWTAETSNFGLTNVGYNAAPTLVDIDNDGDLDAFVGNNAGDTVFFRNTPVNSVASFIAESSNFGLTDVGYSATSTFADIDNDGDLDAFVGNSYGVTQLFVNMAASATNHAPTGTVTINDTTPTQGQILTAANTLNDADGLGSITYQWKAGAMILGTGANHTVTAAEVGKTLTVTASYTDDLGKLETKTSTATAAVTAVTNPNFTLTGNNFITDENGGTAIFSLKLNTAPTRDVSVTFTSLDTSEGIINKTLTFTSSNWSTPQTFTVIGQNDALMDGNISYQVKGVVNTFDVNYSGLTLNLITLTNQDNEVAGQSIYGDVGGSKNDVLIGTEGNDKIYGLNMKDDLSGRGGNDELWGGYDNDVLFGENGNDKLYGEQNDDYMESGAGNDTLDGGLGVDTMKGGAGNDVYYLGYDFKDVIQDGGLATDIDTVIMPYQLTTYTLSAGIENATITAGTQAANLIGNAGNNALTGNDGVNNLNGGTGRDGLFASAGNDVLIGGAGNDTLSGGAGKDIFKFNTAFAANTDKITDFSVINDTIQLENSIFTKLTATGALNAGNFFKGTAAHDTNDYVIYNPSNGVVTYDADGNGAHAAVEIALLGVNLALTAADFVLI